MQHPTVSRELLVLGEELEMYAPSEHEADFQYQEIFRHECYDRFTLRDEPAIVDVGANIGLFTVFAKRRWPQARILAFEPVPATAEYLRRNIALHGLRDVTVVREALGDTDGTEITMVNYPNLPGNSTRYPQDKQLQIDAVARRHPDWDLVEQYRAERVTVPLSRLSSHLSGLPHVDLLKVDAEGAELEILRGIAPEHWPGIDNVVAEVQDLHSRLEATRALLTERGFRCEVEPSPMVYPEIRTYLVTARRPV
ncbi:FkbM family methyltransferase [Micromonospora fluostatini]|uniref:FkbM family methyltransferase n=1 Tax=Micromonospora sp. JCM 30529 TaxID=3421643 RepID=UPI003D1741A1